VYPLQASLKSVYQAVLTAELDALAAPARLWPVGA
jgi:hypothetical protein